MKSIKNLSNFSITLYGIERIIIAYINNFLYVSKKQKLSIKILDLSNLFPSNKFKELEITSAIS